MPSVDGYDEVAAAKLWALLPAVYRAADSLTLDEVGPLQELLARVGVQVGAVKRSLDRLWEDQSIETCEDWVIPYIAALVDTNLVPAMDRRGQRLDVANTINYRRRKGTLGLIEQLAADVTGWECVAVEGFRTLARTRHGLDLGEVRGGRADLRHATGPGAFDPFHHRADVRVTSYHGIPKIALFLWQLVSLPVERATPVPVKGCSGHFTFDPTGRQIALFQPDDRPDGYGEHWVPLSAEQVPGPISQTVADVWPEVGRFKGTGDDVSYFFGLPSRLGAGGYDRRRVGVVEPADPLPVIGVPGAATLSAPARGTVVIEDGRTITAADDVIVEELAIRADDEQRAVIRVTGDWTFTGSGRLRLEGLLFSGADLILRGDFDEVIVSCCTLDPGNAGETSVDGRALVPTTLRVDGTVRRLTLDRSITGPVTGGVIEELRVSDSIIAGVTLDAGVVALNRVTVLGKLDVHRLECSESILDDVATVANVQDGCLRFSAWASGSVLPRKYECVRVAPRAPLFVTRRFGEAHFAQLDSGCDEHILGGWTAGAPSIRAGSHDGSEMGAYCRDAAAVKERSLLIKLKEYLPVGLTPVLVPMPSPDPEAEATRGKPWPST